MPSRLPLLITLISLLTAGMLIAHPLPDVPVTTKFEADGTCAIHAVVDPRCFASDPNTEPYLLNQALVAMDAKAKDALLEKVRNFLAQNVTFHFLPTGEFKPTFELTFHTLEDQPLAKADDPVMVTADCKISVPAGANEYQIKVTPAGTFAFLYFNYLNGVKLERFQVLFPGEESYKLDLHQRPAAVPAEVPQRAAIHLSGRVAAGVFGLVAVTLTGIHMIRRRTDKVN